MRTGKDVWEKIEKLSKLNLNSQRSEGLMRQCELDLIKDICIDQKIQTYIELGCGLGFTLYKVSPYVEKVIGYDHLPNMKFDVFNNIEYRQRNLFEMPGFSEKVLKEIQDDIQNKKTLIYCDNGHKIGELVAISKIVKPGDIIGTHDFPTEVPFESTLFLADGFHVLEEYEPYIEEHACLQRFWEKL